MKTGLKNFILFSLLFLSYISFSYYYFGSWWNSSVGTVLILLFAYFIWKKDFLKQTGLQLDLNTIGKSIILTGIIATGAFFLMKWIAAHHNIEITYTNWKDYYHDVFYILNEEVVIGAILLFFLVNKKKMHPLIAATSLAIVFALIHFVFYKWIFLDSGVLGISTLATLFFVGFVRNSLILQSGHIGYSWALHFGWMSIMFGCRHSDETSLQKISESERFNIYLGSPAMLIISAVLALLILAYWIRKTE